MKKLIQKIFLSISTTLGYLGTLILAGLLQTSCVEPVKSVSKDVGLEGKTNTERSNTFYNLNFFTQGGGRIFFTN